MDNKKHIPLRILIPAMCIQLIAAFWYFYFVTDGVLAKAIYTATKVLLICLPIVTIYICKYRLPPLAQTQNKNKSIIYGAIWSVVIIVFVYTFNQLWPDIIASATTGIEAKAEQWNMLAYFIPFAIFVSLIHSGLEEYYWRWFIFRGLTAHMNWKAAAMVGSLAFTSHHVIVVSQFFDGPIILLFSTLIFFMGVIWCVIYKKTNSLWGLWLSHLVADAILLYIGYTLLF